MIIYKRLRETSKQSKERVIIGLCDCEESPREICQGPKNTPQSKHVVVEDVIETLQSIRFFCCYCWLTNLTDSVQKTNSASRFFKENNPCHMFKKHLSWLITLVLEPYFRID